MLGAALLAGSACGRRNADALDAQPEPPAAWAPVPAGMPLDRSLEMLNEELETVLRAGLDEPDITQHLLRAEVITDRLLEANVPFGWLTGEAYSVEAKLRQIQALADRIVAEIRSQAPGDSVLADVRQLRHDTSAMRAELAAGGAEPPTPIKDLLAGRDSARTPSTARPGG